jgi:hypothetical protein
MTKGKREVFGSLPFTSPVEWPEFLCRHYFGAKRALCFRAGLSRKPQSEAQFPSKSNRDARHLVAPDLAILASPSVDGLVLAQDRLNLPQ